MISHAIKISNKGKWHKNVTRAFIPGTAKLIYIGNWKAGLLRFLDVYIYQSNALLYLYKNETGQQKILTLENNPENLKKIWASKRGIVRNFKKKESKWTEVKEQSNLYID